ncbi:hypothetical protein [Pseudoramibacter porci]|uniref:Uncharacterized protein n=1 Tax=Pseudoramibacter porci TaxID=2606631 RepID=A0A7X2TAW2_9FIRM|nr:hypothetical protein [Pseudoramibacter porci]MSS20530.1 hypothetical protein [Pseudoramibacter porci]
MAKFDFSKLKKTLKASAEDAKIAAEKVQESVKENMPDSIKKAAQSETAVAISDKLNKAVEKGKSTLSETSERLKKTREDTKNALREARESKLKNLVSSETALKIIYYLIISDGQINADEKEQFNAIGQSMLDDFESVRFDMMSKGDEILVHAGEKAYGDLVYEAVILDLEYDHIESPDQSIKARQLLWNLIVVSYSDGLHSDTEQRIIDAIMRKWDISDAVLQEMLEAMETLLAIQSEKKRFSASQRPYAEVQIQVKELENREAIIMQSIHQLIADV